MTNEPDYDPDDEVYRLNVDWQDGESVATGVVDGVASIRGVESSALPPLDDAIDVDALGEVFGPRYGRSLRNDGHVTFPYDGFSVTVRAEGVVVIEPTDDPAASGDDDAEASDDATDGE